MESLELGQIALHAEDVAKLTEFYRDVIGLKFLFTAGPTLSFFSLGSVRLMISTNESDDSHKNSVLYFKTIDIVGQFKSLQSQVNFVDEPHLIATMPDHELWMVFFRDPESNLLGFMEERKLV